MSVFLPRFGGLATFIVLTAVLFAAGVVPVAEGKGFGGLGSSITREDIDASADSLEFVSGNLVATGHVVVKYKDIFLSCDRAIINMDTKDIQADGRVGFIQRTRESMSVTYDEYKKLLDEPDVKVTVDAYVMTPTGRQDLEVTIVKEVNSWTGQHADGNLTTGIFDLGDFSGHYDAYYVNGKDGERAPDGTITVKDATLTTCEYIEDHHEHYSVTATTVEMIPTKSGRDDKYYSDKGHYGILAWNSFLRVGGLPIFYFPVLYKPPDGHGLGIQVKGGMDSDWGWFVLTRKTFKVYDYPNTHVTLMADYYGKRGPGGGIKVKSATRDSYTEGFVYGVYDGDVDERKARFKYDKYRYDIYATHLNHITPRLDFRGRFEALSDLDFLHDFFRSREDENPQPATYAALEYQFDRLSVSAMVRPRVNDFFSVVERLPELRMDLPRQELFYNLYYQGETTFNYLRMKWRDYDYPRSGGGQDINDYETVRFDSLHMFYYPFKVSAINLIPRAGFRVTAYSKTSKQGIDQKQLNTYFTVDSPFTDPAGGIVNYDSKGHSDVRFAAELGIEANTKIYRTWNDIKSAFWSIDGIRHVMVPYVNYTFIPDTNVDRRHLYYFDDVDRITEQNFFRVGVQNRLQTRRGAYGHQEIYTWASLENYIDFHFDKEKGFSKNLGDFGTIFKFNPIPNLSATTDLLVDIGNGDINRFSTQLQYAINEKWKVYVDYHYQRDYDQRSAYSMGSTLMDMDAGTAFSRHYNKYQTVGLGIEFPIFSKTRGELEFRYDIEGSRINEARAKIVRQLHCWEAGLEYRVRERNDDTGDKEWKQTVMFTLSLTALPSVKIQAKAGLATGGGGDDGPNN
jgi:lipopolysaccharide assembly outer membrane protein LptD (OstA)